MLIDSNCHPTINGRWLKPDAPDCSFTRLASGLRAAGFTCALATGLPGVGGYDAERYMEFASADPLWIPVAAWTRPVASASSRDFEALKRMGYRMVKIHPRLLAEPLQGGSLGRFVALAHDAALPVAVCCYPFRPAGSGVQGDLLSVLEVALADAPTAKLMLMHAGCVDLLRYMEFARVNPGILLDLSFTLCKYDGSSLDLDIAFAFRTYDRRICIGSDYPEFSFALTRSRFEHFCHGLDPEKVDNIAGRNLLRFLAIEQTG